MKSPLVRIVVLLMVIGMLVAGCVPAPAAPAQPAAQPAEPAQPAEEPTAAVAAEEQVSVVHYFSDTLGKETITGIFNEFTKETGIPVIDNTTGHEDFKAQILVMLAGDNPPDAFSYWAGARVQFVVDSERLEPIDDMWDANKLGDVVPAALAAKATMYNGERYLIPFGYHYAGMFYNPKVMAQAGIAEFPKTWDEFLAMCQKLKDAGITPIALGSKNRWPAQFWFDYLLLRTAGPEYRQKLMDGQAAYTDPEVVKAMEMWKELVDKGYFVENANAYDWTDAADQVANGKAAMTLMGTWITGYWNGNNLKPVDDYDFFPFPSIVEGVEDAVVGPVDGWVMAAGAKDKEATKKLLSYLVSNVDASSKWAVGQGALSPNVNADPSIYTPVMLKAAETVAAAPVFAFNYDLATTPPMAEGGLNMFAQFMDNPANYADYLEQTETVAVDVFKKQ
jgi:multiple sugar transport system substrate-binding protein/raffinose/stachyose/melibiose transport system substrate-binding protein